MILQDRRPILQTLRDARFTPAAERDSHIAVTKALSQFFGGNIINLAKSCEVPGIGRVVDHQRTALIQDLAMGL